MKSPRYSKFLRSRSNGTGARQKPGSTARSRGRTRPQMAGSSELPPASTTNERWKRVDQLLQSALEREPGQRAAFLYEACAGDTSLLQEVESLLLSHEQAADFLERPSLVALQRFAAERAGLLVGRSIGPYELLSLLGTGGMGEVYRATDTRLKGFGEIKVLCANSPVDVRRLQYSQV